jgi:diguanylate cyclase (GGDEF)-like protein
MLKVQRYHAAGPARPASAPDPSSHEETAAALQRLTALVEAQARTIRDYEAVARNRDLFDRVAAGARLGVWECDLTTEALHWSPGTYDIFDIPRDTPLVRKQTLSCYPAHSLKKLEAVRSRALREGNSFDVEAEILTGQGNRRWIRINGTVERAGNRPIRLFGIKQDVSEEKAEQARLLALAEFDGLTGLANRTAFERRLTECCRRWDQADGGGALLYIDLDGFKELNDTLGHSGGDEGLREAAQRLATVCRHAVVTVRLGGDEFAVLLDAPTPGTPSVPGVAARIVQAMSRPLHCLGRTFRIGASVGIAYADGCPPDELVRRADMALYAAKAGGRNTFRIFDPRFALTSAGGQLAGFR